GAALTRCSALDHTSPVRSADKVTVAPSTGRPERLTATTSAPNARNLGIMARPIPPQPTMATVEPCRVRTCGSRRSLIHCVAVIDVWNCRSPTSKAPTAYSATLSAYTPDAFAH